MGTGRLNTFIDIVTVDTVKDSEGFGSPRHTKVASVRAYREDRYASEKWANRASFSEASVLFRFRRIPGLDVTEDMVIVSKDGQYNITGVRDIRNRRMYLEVLAKKVVGSGG